jgi:hypothetical protein
MASGKLKRADPPAQRLAEALRIADFRRDRQRLRRGLRGVVPVGVGHHEAEARVRTREA